MHVLATVLLADTKMPIIFPSYVFGIIAGSIFLLLGVVTWTYRDVANRHANRAAAQSHDNHNPADSQH